MSLIGTIQALVSRIGPYFLHGRNIGRFLESIAVTYDSGIESLQQGMLLSNPLKCDPSALPVLSIDRGIRLFASEPIASKRIRLAKWLKLHRQRGTHQGELRHSQPYFLPDTPIMRIVHQDGAGASATWHTLAADGTYAVHRATPSNWNYDGLTTQWSRFWVILYVPASILNLSHWDDGSTWDGGDVYDGMLTQVAKDLVAMVLEWQGAHERLQAYILATDPASFDPTATAVTDPTGWTSLPVGNWGHRPTSGASHRTRPPSAMWIYER